MDKTETPKTMRLIYALGSGCWCYSAIPKRLRSPSFFNQGGGVRIAENIFLPQTLFDGRLREKFFDASAWKFTVMKHRPDDGEALYDAQADIPELGFRMGHVNISPEQFRHVNVVANAEAMFKFFDDNKYRQLFVIDFSRGSYMGCSNVTLLGFESFLVNSGFDLKNFIYCDVDQRQVPGRFDGCGVKVFSYDNTETKYKKLGMFRCVRKMFDEEKPYLDGALRRISGENMSFMEMLSENNHGKEVKDGF